LKSQAGSFKPVETGWGDVNRIHSVWELQTRISIRGVGGMRIWIGMGKFADGAGGKLPVIEITGWQFQTCSNRLGGLNRIHSV